MRKSHRQDDGRRCRHRCCNDSCRHIPCSHRHQCCFADGHEPCKQQDHLFRNQKAQDRSVRTHTGAPHPVHGFKCHGRYFKPHDSRCRPAFRRTSFGLFKAVFERGHDSCDHRHHVHTFMADSNSGSGAYASFAFRCKIHLKADLYDVQGSVRHQGRDDHHNR